MKVDHKDKSLTPTPTHNTEHAHNTHSRHAHKTASASSSPSDSDQFSKPVQPKSAGQTTAPSVLPGSEPASAATGAESVKVPVVAVSRTVKVSNDSELKAALAAAQPGDKIQLAPGNYTGPVTLSGKKGVTLAGSEGTVINTSSTKKPSLSLTDCSDCSLMGLTIKGGQKGVMVSSSPNTVLDHCDVSNTQMEGVHFKNNSTGCVIQNSSVHDTGKGGDTPAGNGRVQSDDGEGVYVGTAKSNNPSGDATNGVKIINNTIYNTTAENIDIKEFTQGGLITGNKLDGKGCGSGATANVEVKGSGYIVTGNTITNPYKTGIKNYSVSGVPNSGTNNTISDNITA